MTTPKPKQSQKFEDERNLPDCPICGGERPCNCRKEDWEERFDEKFPLKIPLGIAGHYGMKRNIVPREDIKDFITSEIRQAQEEILERVEKKIKERMKKLYCTAEYWGYHDKNCDGACEKATLKSVLTTLKKSIKKGV